MLNSGIKLLPNVQTSSIALTYTFTKARHNQRHLKDIHQMSIPNLHVNDFRRKPDWNLVLSIAL